LFCATIQYSTPSKCELPATVTEKLALPEQRQLDPIEACEGILAGMPNPPEIVHAATRLLTAT